MIIVCRLESASLAWLLDVVQGLLLHGSRWLGRVGHLGRGWRKVSVALDGGTAHRSRVHGNGLLRVERWLFLAIIKLFMSRTHCQSSAILGILGRTLCRGRLVLHNSHTSCLH